MSTIPNQHRHITFLDPANENKLELDYEFYSDNCYIHTKVYWKTECVLIIKKLIKGDKAASRIGVRSFDDDDEDEDDTPIEKPSPEVEYLIQTNWPWLKHFYGDYATLEEAKIAAHTELLKIMDQIRGAFMLKAAPAPAPEPTEEPS